MGKICNVMYEIKGIYGWGTGYYSSDLAGAWNMFWAMKQDEKIDDHEHFKVGYMNKGDDVLGHPILYGDSGSLFCHPMTIEGTLQSCNSADSEKFEYERKAIFNFLKDQLVPFIKEKTGVDIQIIENYHIFIPSFHSWIVENKTA